ncbi:hypothetical protein ColTof4_02756 [Colletotrichum tofieldiae]|nr:hypothetical protein ColTof3_08948 [Colletotrichum tofieldiae]GKT70333.1 hypothetical protein ColTof4_02756 [Colletotrichum tofieldiae]
MQPYRLSGRCDIEDLRILCLDNIRRILDDSITSRSFDLVVVVSILCTAHKGHDLAKVEYRGGNGV